MAQGTIYPDVIEKRFVGDRAAAKIKTHHNVGGLPADLRFQLIEPLRHLFKDEVRRWASSWACRTPWSSVSHSRGPGLAIRIIGEVTASGSRRSARPTGS